ncbi:hypothetical protein N0V88_006860 [Collariella sp. IMI 366227]|nr:hypothetical protein N0V88_006860 [Collariella sp. IMI 366227]
MGLLDGYGHLSVRNPDNPPTFFMMHQLAPALVLGLDDVGEYRVSNAEPVYPGTPAAPSERLIHSEVLKRYPDVNVVLYGHPEELISYSISHVPLRAAIHMAPFLGEEVPNFDITNYYLPNGTQDFLVRDRRLGAALAAEFDKPVSHPFSNSGSGYDGDSADTDQEGNDQDNGHGGHDGIRGRYPNHNLVLMRSLGFAAVATDIKLVTYEGIYAVINVKIESEAFKIQHVFTGTAAQEDDGIQYLNSPQIQDSWETEMQTVEKPWALWVREVEVNPLYVNELSGGSGKNENRNRYETR